MAADVREQRARRRTILDGPHLIEAYRQHRGVPESLVLSEAGSRNDEVMRLVRQFPGIDVIQVPDALFRDISGVMTPVGVLAVIPIPEPPTGPLTGTCVMLDAVQDAGNIGTMLRTTAAAGINEVALGNGCAAAWSPKVLRAAQGAHFSLRIREQVDLAAMLKAYAGTSVATVAREGDSLYDLVLPDRVAWVFGNEGSGVNADLVALATLRVTIPIAAETESLNVSAAAAICLFEYVRQRRLAGEDGIG